MMIRLDTIILHVHTNYRHTCTYRPNRSSLNATLVPTQDLHDECVKQVKADPGNEGKKPKSRPWIIDIYPCGNVHMIWWEPTCGVFSDSGNATKRGRGPKIWGAAGKSMGGDIMKWLGE